MIPKLQRLGESFELTAHRSIANNVDFEVVSTKRSSRSFEEQVNALPVDKAPDENEPRSRSGSRPQVPCALEHTKINAIFDELMNLACKTAREGLARSLIGHEQNRCLAFPAQNGVERRGGYSTAPY